MKVGQLSELQEIVSYRNQRFSAQKFIICTRDERYEYNVIPLICLDNGKFIDLDDYDFGNNIFTARPPYNNPNNIEDLPINRFYTNQLIKIDYGTIVENSGAENPNLPKVKTFNANIHSFDTNEVVEYFDGTLNESDSIFTPNSSVVLDLIKNVYVETKNSFFVISKNQLIGPFVALKLNEGSFTIAKSSWKKFGEYHLTDDSYLEFNANELVRKVYFQNSNELNLVFKREIDFLSDEELLKAFELELQSNSEFFDEESLKNIQKILTKSSAIESLEKKVKDNHRIRLLVQRSEKIILRNLELINFFPEIKRIKEDKQNLEDELFDLSKKLGVKKDSINNEITILEETVNNLKNEIENLEQVKTEQLDRRKSELDEVIKILEIRKDNLERDVDLQQKELEKNLEAIKKDIEYYQRQQNELQQTIDNLREDFREEQNKAQLSLQNLVKSKIHFDFISGRDLSESNKDSNDNLKINKIIDKYEKEEYREFRNEIVNILRSQNRNFENHFVDNLLISIFQNTLTIFAGVPGTGKTSLARILSNILSPKDRIREVSINRGWTSQKDFIGYANPLSKKFHSSSSDIYSLLKQLNYESTSPENYLNCPMSFIILDEANLSPLEHYWSSFYNLTDSTGMLEVNLGNTEKITFPNNIRFIGTINYDHTTEELSPRVLDRINIIQLDKAPDLNIANIAKLDLERVQLSFQRCIEYFELQVHKINDFKIDDRIEKAYKEIKLAFRSLKVFISPRVELAIQRYIVLASKYMTDVNKPLDYSIAQRLLPLINLQGAENKHKLELLRETLKENKCEISAKILEEIITIGSDKGVYEDNFNYFFTLSNV